MSVLLYILSTLPLVIMVVLASRRTTRIDAAGSGLPVGPLQEHPVPMVESDAA